MIGEPKSSRSGVVCAWIVLCTALQASAQWQPYEIGIANREAGRARSLAARLSKQNLLYQLHLADVRKEEMHVTANEVDRIIGRLRTGSAFYSVAGPPNESARKQLDVIEKAWIPVRTLALASPYDYLRRAQQFIPPKSPRGDPLIVKSFDKMVGKLIVEIETLMTVYYEECIKTDYRLCAVARRAGQPTMLAERMMRDVVFMHAGIDVEKSAKRLRESSKAFEANWVGFEKSDLYLRATDESRGESGMFIAELRSSISASWAKLAGEVDLAIEGRVDEVDPVSILQVERELVRDFERFTAVMGRFVAGAYRQ